MKIKNILWHGSPVKGLKTINADSSRFGDKIFATSDKQRAVRYMGDGIGSRKVGKYLFVMESDAKKLKNNFQGAIYQVPKKSFKFDPHKGKEKDWIFSSETAVKPIREELSKESVLEVWHKNKIISVPKSMAKK